MTMRYRMVLGMAALAGLLLPCETARALINPNFTPIHLTAQSDYILEVQLGAPKDAVVTATIKTALKGKPAGKTVTLSLKNTAFKEQAEEVVKVMKEWGDQPAIFFIGKINEKGAAPGGAPTEGGNEVEKGFLHFNGRWVSFDKEKDNVWLMNEISTQMLQTWNGGTDMLRLVLDYVLQDPEAVIPCVEGVTWGTPKKFATVAGKVAGAFAITLADGGGQFLFVASDAGDKLYEQDAKSRELKDISAARKLVSKSRVATWGDLNADGRMDLVSWDGEAVTVSLQEADGTLAAGVKLPGIPACKSLAVIDSGTPGKPAVLIGTATVPQLWVPAAGAAAQATKPVAEGEAPVKDLGAAGRCFAADFDGDGYGDILQLFAKGSLVYRGKAAGQFEAPKRSAVELGVYNGAPADAFLGDFDCDGLLDLVTLGENMQMWNNRGKMEFVNVMAATGELSYKGAQEVRFGACGDINGDGRQDVITFYDNDVPHINFNRGFRSFGNANAIDMATTMETTGVIGTLRDGQQTGCWIDLDGNGIQDIVMVLKNGEAWFLPVETGNEKAGCVRALLSSKGAYAGPVNVVGYRGKRCIGAWNLLPGTDEGLVSQTEAGPVTIKWQMPGGKPQSKEITIENAPVKFVLP